jgi:hypothetical protein
MTDQRHATNCHGLIVKGPGDSASLGTNYCRKCGSFRLDMRKPGFCRSKLNMVLDNITQGKRRGGLRVTVRVGRTQSHLCQPSDPNP